MSKAFYDTLEPGMVLELGSHIFTRDEIITFAEKYDPQRFHLTEQGAKNSHFGALCASGWHTASVWMRLNIEHGRDEWMRLTGYKGPPPSFGPSPGIRDLKWSHPVYVDDTITYRSTLTGKRLNPRKQGWAMMTSLSEGFNQDGVKVLSMGGAVTLKLD